MAANQAPLSAALHGARCVAMIDILGFRQLLSSTPIVEIVRRFQTALDEAQSVLVAQIHSPTGVRIRRLGEMHFNDTIVMWTPILRDPEDAEGKTAIGHLIRAVTIVIYESLLKGIPLRAGLAFGDCYIDEGSGIFVGQPIADAYELESSQEWVGGALHPTVPFGIGGAGCMKEYPVPVKAAATVRPRIALNWPDCPDSPEAYRALKAEVHGLLTATIDARDRAKVEHALQFLEFVYEGIRFMRLTGKGEVELFNPTQA